MIINLSGSTIYTSLENTERKLSIEGYIDTQDIKLFIDNGNTKRERLICRTIIDKCVFMNEITDLICRKNKDTIYLLKKQDIEENKLYHYESPDILEGIITKYISQKEDYYIVINIQGGDVNIFHIPDIDSFYNIIKSMMFVGRFSK